MRNVRGHKLPFLNWTDWPFGRVVTTCYRCNSFKGLRYHHQFSLILWIVLVLVSTVSCSTSRGPGLAERDQYVINTPARFSENRVFYFGPLKTTNEVTDLLSTTELTRTIVADVDGGNHVLDKKMVHGEPLNIIVTNATLPQINSADATCKLLGAFWCYTPRTRDIALVLDVDAQIDAPAKQIVVWYQRSVPAEQSLNFGSLQVYHADAWDSRLAPIIRLRLIDVTAEKNIETREALSDVAKFGSSILSGTSGPASALALNAATKAGALILAGSDNKMLLDYTVQFFGAGRVQKGGGSIQTPLLNGRFVLFGRERSSNAAQRDFWGRKYAYDEAEQRICILGTDRKCGADFLTSPTITIAVDSAETVLNSIVQKRSDYLTLLLTQASTSSLDGVEEQANSLSDSIKMYVAKERLFRYRQIEDLSSLVTLVSSTGDSEMRNVGMKLVRQVTNCPALDSANVSAWWSSAVNSATVDTSSESPKFSVSCQ